VPEGALVEPDAEHAVPGVAAAEEEKVWVSWRPPRISLSHMHCLKERVTLPGEASARTRALLLPPAAVAAAKPV